jgi:hypothetical protein
MCLASGAGVKERRTLMIPSTPWPPTHTEYDQAEAESNQADMEDKEREELQSQLSGDLLLPQEEVEEREQEIKRDFHTPLGGTYLVSWMIVFLLVIGILVLLILFHPVW